MTTTVIDITTKKDHTQKTTWGIVQERPYPSVEARFGRSQWTNFGGLLADYNGKVNGLEERYTCNLLRSDQTEWDMSTRVSYAGYKDYPAYGQPPKPDAPGTIVYRGVDMGEMSVSLGRDCPYEQIQVRGFHHPTPGERSFITSQIVPALRQAVEANREALKQEAIAGIRAHVAEKLKEGRAALDKMQKEMENAISAL